MNEDSFLLARNISVIATRSRKMSHRAIGVGMTVLTSPLPPNRTDGFPASGFPVSKFPRVFMLRGWQAWLGLRLSGRLVQVPPSSCWDSVDGPARGLGLCVRHGAVGYSAGACAPTYPVSRAS